MWLSVLQLLKFIFLLGRPQQIRVNIEPPKSQTVDEGTSVRFVCVARGAMEV